MATSFETVKNILSNQKNKSNIWTVNTENEYHETKKDEKIIFFEPRILYLKTGRLGFTVPANNI